MLKLSWRLPLRPKPFFKKHYFLLKSTPTPIFILLVPILQKKTLVSGAEEIKHAIAHHATVLQSISKSFSSKILSLNWPLPALQNATLHMTLMVVTTASGKKLFLSADPTWNGQGYLNWSSLPNPIQLKEWFQSADGCHSFVAHNRHENFGRHQFGGTFWIAAGHATIHISAGN